MIFMLGISYKYLFIIIGCALFLVVLAIFLIFINRKGNNKVKVDDQFIRKLVENLGNKTNIVDVNNESGRVKITLENLELAKLEEIKSMSTAGIFITNNTIKMLFTYDSDLIVKSMKSYRED